MRCPGRNVHDIASGDILSDAVLDGGAANLSWFGAFGADDLSAHDQRRLAALDDEYISLLLVQLGGSVLIAVRHRERMVSELGLFRACRQIGRASCRER